MFTHTQKTGPKHSKFAVRTCKEQNMSICNLYATYFCKTLFKGVGCWLGPILSYTDCHMMLVPWINHLSPVCRSTFWKSSLKWCVCKFDIMENDFFIVLITYILTPHNMIMRYFHLPNFHVLNSALLFTQYSGTLVLHRCSLDTFYVIN